VFSLPGSIDSPYSKGTHFLIKEGAKLVENVEDILEGLGIEKNVSLKEEAKYNLSSEEERVYNILNNEEDIESIKLKTGLSLKEISQILLTLQIKHLIRELPGKRFIRI
ncbi:DNA-protecting protein DprA, partial [Candidatus Woesearchaeota archaeon]